MDLINSKRNSWGACHPFWPHLARGLKGDKALDNCECSEPGDLKFKWQSSPDENLIDSFPSLSTSDRLSSCKLFMRFLVPHWSVCRRSNWVRQDSSYPMGGCPPEEETWRLLWPGILTHWRPIERLDEEQFPQLLSVNPTTSCFYLFNAVKHSMESSIISNIFEIKIPRLKEN